MTDDLPALTPAETERVRRLLAEARHTAPVPPDVAARLDRTLATLGSERTERTVVTLRSRRRRQVVQLLVAAVAVVSLGVGLGTVFSGLGGDDDSSTASGGSAATDQDDSLAERAPTGSPDKPSAESAPEGGADRISLPRVDEGTFDRDVAALQETPRAALGGDDASADSAACERATWGEGRRVPVRYDGRRAVLVFRPVLGLEQSVDLFACGGDVPLRTTVVPAP